MSYVIIGVLAVVLILFSYCACVVSSECSREEERMMNTLEMYKRLSNEDKGNLTIYSIYDSIYSVARNEEKELSDDIVKDIQELAHDLYLDDEYYNLSSPKIADFLTRCYVKDNEFLKKIEDVDYSDILEAISDDDYDFYENEEIKIIDIKYEFER